MTFSRRPRHISSFALRRRHHAIISWQDASTLAAQLSFCPPGAVLPRIPTPKTRGHRSNSAEDLGGLRTQLGNLSFESLDLLGEILSLLQRLPGTLLLGTSSGTSSSKSLRAFGAHLLRIPFCLGHNVERQRLGGLTHLNGPQLSGLDSATRRVEIRLGLVGFSQRHTGVFACRIRGENCLPPGLLDAANLVERLGKCQYRSNRAGEIAHIVRDLLEIRFPAHFQVLLMRRVTVNAVVPSPPVMRGRR